MLIVEQTHLARTGRTTRMLEAAVKAYENGKAVYVVFTPGMWGMMKARLSEYPGMHVETLASLGANSIDWRNLRTQRSHPNCAFFFDHHLLNQHVVGEYQTFLYRNAAAISGVHAYDLPLPTDMIDLGDVIREVLNTYIPDPPPYLANALAHAINNMKKEK